MGSTNKKIYTFFRNIFISLPEPLVRWYEIFVEHLLLKKFYISSPLTNHPEEKELIVIFDNKVNPGGLSDRINGMISTYKLAESIGYEFKISHKNPFKLEHYLIPNVYDWTIEDSKISYNKNSSYPIFIRELATPNVDSRIKSFRKTIISNENISQYHCYTNLLLLSDDEFNHYFHILFKPSKLLQDSIDFHKDRIGGKYISITFRFQQLLGDFKEGNFPKLEESKRNGLIKECLDAISKISSRHPDMKILVTSDSVTFLNQAKEILNVYTIPGKLVHMAFTSDQSVETHLKSFIDLFMVANAEKIYLVNSDKLYNSGFPRLASKIYSRPFELITI